jgi:hypothetical protein
MSWHSLGVGELVVLICCPSSMLVVVLGVVLWLVTRNRSKQ